MNQPPMKKQSGFTFIELMVVIVIIGILSATALPKMINFTGNARASAMDGLAGNVRSIIPMVNMKALTAEQVGPIGSINIEGKEVKLIYGFPSAASLQDVFVDSSGFDFSVQGDTVVISNGAQDVSKCSLSYTQAKRYGTPSVIFSKTNCE